jgi:perosamine synthetase
VLEDNGSIDGSVRVPADVSKQAVLLGFKADIAAKLVCLHIIRLLTVVGSQSQERESLVAPPLGPRFHRRPGLPPKRMTSTSSGLYLPFARPSITEREKAAVLEVLDSGWLTTGPRTKLFEEQFAERVGVSHAVALNSATAALHLALESLGVGPGDEVIIPTWTFAASGEVVAYRGARPVLVDIDRSTLNATPESVMAAVTPRTRAVMAVHVAGLPIAIDRLVELLDPLGIPVVEDAAHAFPSQIGGPSGRYVGTFGRVGAFSFYATKTITTGEGGMLVTNDVAIADRVRVMSLHGISRDAWNRYAASGSWYYEIEDAGYKYNMTDIAAALGVVQLDRADELFAARRELAATYTARLRESTVHDLIEVPAEATDGSHAWHLYIIRLDLDRISVDRAGVIDALKDAGIGTSVHFIPLHLHPYYQKRWGYTARDLPIATGEYARALSLPIWPGMSLADVDRVVAALSAVLAPARR